MPRTLDDLAQHRLVHYAATFGARADGFEYVDPGATDGRMRVIEMPGALTVNNSEAYLAACLAGLGIIQSPDVALRGLLRSGQLVEVLPQFRAAPMPVSLLYANRRHLPRRVQAFMAWMATLMQAYLV